MLKQIVLFLSLFHLMQCLPTRSNIWWSRRTTNSDKDCDIQLNYDNPSLEAKICGYCFAKCQQHLAACLLAQMSEMLNGSIDLCQEQSNKCEKRCFNDKRTGRIAEANWAKVVKVLQNYNSNSNTHEDKQH